jgi:hypothetical protein
MPRLYDKINQSAFNSYDPDYFDNEEVRMDRYDPDYADAPASTSQGGAATNINAARPGQKMNINITINNPTAVKIKFELFSAFASWADVLRADLVTGAFTMIPQLSTQGLGTVGVGTVGYDQDGVLNVYGAAPPSATIGCGEYPYISLVRSSAVLPFRVTFGRIAVLTTPQLNNQLVHFTKTMAGGYKQNQINVRAYKKPTQFQNLEVDILAPFVIDGEKGLLYALESLEQVQLSLFINRWTRPQV